MDEVIGHWSGGGTTLGASAPHRSSTGLQRADERAPAEPAAVAAGR